MRPFLYKATAIILSLVLFLSGSGCSFNKKEPAPEPPVVAPEAHPDSIPPLVPFYSEEPLSIEETIEEYFNQHYLSYSSLEYIDMDYFLDTTVRFNKSMIDWSKMLIQRRRLIKENNLCYVDTAIRPFSISYEFEPEDPYFASGWGKENNGGGDVTMYLRISGEQGEAYPPIMALNSQHIIFLKEVDGFWKITRHYFPGAVHKYLRTPPTVLTKEEMLESLTEEFADSSMPEPEQVPAGVVPYSPEAAVAYAMTYTDTKNFDYYDIGDFIGNCANFVSQCLSNGLEERETTQWYAGDGGGSPEWETVGYFWDYVKSNEDVHGQAFYSVSSIKTGDILATKTIYTTEPARNYNHILIVVDDDTLKLAQNSPNCFVYYSDLLGVEHEAYRPEYLS